MEKPAVSPLFQVPADITALANRPVPATAPAPKKSGGGGILGALGEYLLDATGLGDIIKERKINSAMQNFDQDPLGTINTVSGIDYQFGSKLRDQYIDNQRLIAAQAATAEDRAARLALAQTAANDRTRNRVASMLGSMAGWDETKRQTGYALMREQALKYASANGLDLSTELPDQYDGVALDSFIDASVPVGTQRTQRLASARQEETVRSNAVKETISKERLSETKRHNQVTEGQGQQRIGISAARANAPRGDGAKNILTYVGEDGYKYAERSDGKVYRSRTKVRASGGAGKPTEGMRRVINGKTYVWKNGRAVAE